LVGIRGVVPVHLNGLILEAGLFESDMAGSGTGTGRVIQFHGGDLLVNTVISNITDKGK
jgi:hypothetical protein